MVKLQRLFSVLAFVVAMFIVGTQVEGCSTDLKGLVQECMQYVILPNNPKIPPSAGCCLEVKKVDIPCMCAKFTTHMEKSVSMEKVVYVARECGKPIEPGSKCGSYTVPNN